MIQTIANITAYTALLLLTVGTCVHHYEYHSGDPCLDKVMYARGKCLGKAAKETHWHHQVGCYYGVELSCKTPDCLTEGNRLCKIMFPDAPIMIKRKDSIK